MLKTVVNGIVAAVILVVALAMGAIMFGFDSSLVSNLLGAAVEVIIAVGVIGILGAVVYGIAEAMIEA